MREIGTRVVPWQRVEVSHARNRPLAERPPLPEVGQQVYYRRFEWDRDGKGDLVEPRLAEVVEVQAPGDVSDQDYLDGVGAIRDPNLWHLIRDVRGVPLRDLLGTLRYSPVADPWPWVRLRRPDDIIDGTREARLRGSAGWLPLDYLRRPERWRMPDATALISTRPVLRPLTVYAPKPRPGM